MPSLPSEREIVERLKELFRERPEYTFSALMRFVEPPSAEQLALILDDLAKHGAIERVFRLTSPFTHLELGEFNSILDVPNHFYDEVSEEEFDVRRENVLPIFRRRDLEHA
jgi:hypothetical protein